MESSLGEVSRTTCSSGKTGVRCSKTGRLRPLSLVGGEAVDFLDADEAEVALALLGRAYLAGDGVAGAEAEAADLGLGDINVAGGTVGEGLAEEAVAFVHDLEDAGGYEGLVGGGDLEHASEEVFAVHVAEGCGGRRGRRRARG